MLPGAKRQEAIEAVGREQLRSNLGRVLLPLTKDAPGRQGWNVLTRAFARGIGRRLTVFPPSSVLVLALWGSLKETRDIVLINHSTHP